MKKFFALILALVLALSIAACGKTNSATPAPAQTEPAQSKAAEPSAPEELVWWTYFGDTNIGYLQEILDRFNASQTQYHATIEFQGSQAEMNAKIGSTSKADLPALFSGAVENVAMYTDSDYCKPLQPYIDADKDGWKELDETWTSIRAAYQDDQGNQIGYPIGYSYGGIFYNADLFEKAGIDALEIQSMDDLYAACEKLVKGGFCTYGIGFHPDGFYFNGVLGREGLQAYNAGNGYDGQITECLYMDGGKVQSTITHMLEQYQNLYKNNLAIAWGSDYQSEIIPQLASGDCAMMMGVVSMTTKVLTSVNGAFDIGIIPLPSATEAGLRSGEPAGGTGTYICDNGNEAQMQGAYELIKYMSTGDEAAFFSTKTGYLAPNQGSYDSATYQDYITNVFPAITAVYDSLAKSDSSANNPYIPISNEMKNANKLVIQTITGDTAADITKALGTANETLQEAIDLYNAAN